MADETSLWQKHRLEAKVTEVLARVAALGQHSSLAQYRARHLSRGIKAGHIRHSEGASLSHLGMVELARRHGAETLRSSFVDRGYELSMFRLKQPAYHHRLSLAALLPRLGLKRGPSGPQQAGGAWWSRRLQSAWSAGVGQHGG